MKKILVVDDDENIVDVVKELLTSQGFEVYTHASSSNVASVIKQVHPNLILLDIRLYGKLGTELCKELKQKVTIPIILFSADLDKGRDFSECNADAFIQKPFDVHHLLNTVTSHLK